jgi:tetratricopeptide (TPR) repeat protein
MTKPEIDSQNSVESADEILHHPPRLMDARFRRLGARFITVFGLNPSGMLIALIDRLSDAPDSRLGRALIPVLHGSVASESGRATIMQDKHDELTSAERRNLIVAGAGIAADRPERAIEVLGSFLKAHDLPVHPRIYERLANAYILTKRSGSAEEILRHALAAHPDDAGLQLALVNAFSSGSRWRAAIDRWERLSGSTQGTSSVWTNIGMVRAYRNSGEPEKAASVAMRATERWPQNEELQQEVLRCRPFLVDWKNSWEGSAPAIGEDISSDSSVDSLGFMKGGRAPLRGKIGSCDADHPEVALTVNGRTITSTVAAGIPTNSTAKHFSINCADMLQFIGDGDNVEIVCESNTVPMKNLGASAILDCDHESRVDALFEKLNAGFVFTKEGRLLPEHDDHSKKKMLELFARVSHLVSEHTGQPVYPFYGNLLGTIRENDFIKHDVGGFDSLYLCEGNTPDSVKAEIATLYTLLAEREFHLTIKPYSIMIRMASGDLPFIDMNYGWFDALNKLNVSFGSRFEPACGRDRFVRHRLCQLFDRKIQVPGNAEEVLCQLYGPEWRIPDQGFPTFDRLHRDDTFLLSKPEIMSLESAIGK